MKNISSNTLMSNVNYRFARRLAGFDTGFDGFDTSLRSYSTRRRYATQPKSLGLRTLAN